MRTTITLDDELLEQAGRAIGTHERAVVLREGLKALIEREAARRLIQLGGSVPNAQLPPRRRPAATGKTNRKHA
ncbi:MAG: type II toxin-antitoxin system VapB family antitoxin [Rhodanobacteraceae bacterium]